MPLVPHEEIEEHLNFIIENSMNEKWIRTILMIRIDGFLSFLKSNKQLIDYHIDCEVNKKFVKVVLTLNETGFPFSILRFERPTVYGQRKLKLEHLANLAIPTVATVAPDSVSTLTS
jgi:hypothetical protein